MLLDTDSLMDNRLARKTEMKGLITGRDKNFILELLIVGTELKIISQLLRFS